MFIGRNTRFDSDKVRLPARLQALQFFRGQAIYYKPSKDGAYKFYGNGAYMYDIIIEEIGNFFINKITTFPLYKSRIISTLYLFFLNSNSSNFYSWWCNCTDFDNPPYICKRNKKWKN